MRLLVAEIGNNHFGSIKSAREHIRVARESGADAVKFQAFKADDISGSMPKDFYKQCALTFDQYVELIEYGKAIKTPVFFSVFSEAFRNLIYRERYHKIAGNRSQFGYMRLWYEDSPFLLVSVNSKALKLPPWERAQILHVSKYMADDPEFHRIDFLRQYYGRPIGYSDHTLGIEKTCQAIRQYGCRVVEKHFTLKKSMYWGEHCFRDTIHGALPHEFEVIANVLVNAKD